LSGRGAAKKSFMTEAMPHLDALYRYAVRSRRDPLLAQDLVQETYKEAWKSFGNFEPGTNCKAWLFRIFFRVSNRQIRVEQRINMIALEDIPDRKLAVSPEIEEEVERSTILEVLETMPEHYRSVMVLADIEEMSYKEVSDSLGLPVGTVMSRLSRARSFFRERYLARVESLQSA
jgi:RNA polymerase sigma-70 factor (ECF subfamily)